MSRICSYCGHFEDDDKSTSCSICGRPFLDDPVAYRYSEAPTSPQSQGSFNELPDEPSGGNPVSPQPTGNLCPAGPPGRPNPLQGVISLIQRSEERPPPNYYRFFSNVIILTSFLPIYIGAFIVSFVLAVAFAILRLPGLAQLFNPIAWTSTLFGFFEVLVLGRIGRSDHQVIYRGLIRDDEHNLYAFCMFGGLVTGNFVEGHRVSLYGQWRTDRGAGPHERGTFYVNRGEDIETGSSITSSYRNPWRVVFYILLTIFAGLLVFGAIFLPGIASYTNSNLRF